LWGVKLVRFANRSEKLEKDSRGQIPDKYLMSVIYSNHPNPKEDDRLQIFKVYQADYQHFSVIWRLLSVIFPKTKEDDRFLRFKMLNNSTFLLSDVCHLLSFPKPFLTSSSHSPPLFCHSACPLFQPPAWAMRRAMGADTFTPSNRVNT
jgi:hypothetical protein